MNQQAALRRIVVRIVHPATVPHCWGNCSHLGEHTRLEVRAGRPRRVYEGKMPSLPGDMGMLTLLR